MYRQYENPWKLERQLADAQERYNMARSDVEREFIAEEINDLRERVNFAWQDDEYESYDE